MQRRVQYWFTQARPRKALNRSSLSSSFLLLSASWTLMFQTVMGAGCTGDDDDYESGVQYDEGLLQRHTAKMV